MLNKMNVNRLEELSVVTWKPPSVIIPVVDPNNCNVQINVDMMLRFLENKISQGHEVRITWITALSFCKSY